MGGSEGRTAAMRVTISLFAQMRVQSGFSSLDLELPAQATLGEALERFYGQHPELRPHRGSARAAVGLEYADADRVLKDGEEILLIPPVQGG